MWQNILTFSALFASTCYSQEDCTHDFEVRRKRSYFLEPRYDCCRLRCLLGEYEKESRPLWQCQHRTSRTRRWRYGGRDLFVNKLHLTMVDAGKGLGCDGACDTQVWKNDCSAPKRPPFLTPLQFSARGFFGSPRIAGITSNSTRFLNRSKRGLAQLHVT